MFVLRSAFWLTIGFLFVAPHGTDFGAAATNLRDGALASGYEVGSRMIVSQISDLEIPDLFEPAPKPQAKPVLELSPVGPPAFPRPRPAALG